MRSISSWWFYLCETKRKMKKKDQQRNKRERETHSKNNLKRSRSFSCRIFRIGTNISKTDKNNVEFSNETWRFFIMSDLPLFLQRSFFSKIHVRLFFNDLPRRSLYRCLQWMFSKKNKRIIEIERCSLPFFIESCFCSTFFTAFFSCETCWQLLNLSTRKQTQKHSFQDKRKRQKSVSFD